MAGIRCPHVLLVDDDIGFCRDLTTFLEEEFDCDQAHDGETALAKIKRNSPAVVLLDVDLGTNPDGFGVMKGIDKFTSKPSVIMLTGDREVGTVVRALKSGAFHYLCKPPEITELMNLIRMAAEKQRLTRKVAALEEQINESSPPIVARDSRTRQMLADIDKVAPTDATVLLTGESGTGKELAARRIHERSQRRGNALVALNCAAIPDNLVESELFGHEKGAFTGAERPRLGKFALADGGTLFLDEIGDAPLTLQVKLLRVLEERQYYRVGGEKPERADVRVVAATARNIDRMTRTGEFREELLHRLNVYRIHLPALRDRRMDILPLARHFLGEFA